MERLRRAFLRFDERFGGTEPPPRVQVFLARHPVGTGVVHGVFQGLLFAAVLSAFDDPGRMLQAVLVGLGAGLFAWLVCRFERRRQAHYERKGGFRSAPVYPVESDALPVWLEGLLWISHWSIFTVVLWLVGQLKDPPDSWLRSAILAGVIIIGGWAARLFRDRRRR
ncbi:hypothetical protein QFZ75_003277 [Streptomyces sp. V3I8]|uniref:hypothetical protein n=1 Tax=Streptomyces sp. V3I8 TaxID=3042279 RepID=UPI0027818FB6|nr:hypothetical protein [Streptomyces sp. V3I8]MDQ1036861.1 hypothetical protein [Streptomyces sp. V3I8]